MATNTTWWNNASTPGDVISGVINSTDGSFIIVMEIALFFIVFVALRSRNYETDEILIYQGAFHFILLILATSGGWVAFSWIMFPTVMLFAGIMIKKLGGI